MNITTYDDYLAAKEAGEGVPSLPDFFNGFMDEALYSAADIAQTTTVSREIVYQWFRSKKLTSVSLTSRYSAEGHAIKQFLFELLWPKRAA